MISLLGLCFFVGCSTVERGGRELASSIKEEPVRYLENELVTVAVSDARKVDILNNLNNYKVPRVTSNSSNNKYLGYAALGYTVKNILVSYSSEKAVGLCNWLIEMENYRSGAIAFLDYTILANPNNYLKSLSRGNRVAIEHSYTGLSLECKKQVRAAQTK